MNAKTTELLRIADENHGVLRAEDVIQAAEPKDSVLHDYFTWNDDKAGHLWRLEEARRLIRVTVQYIESNKDLICTKVFVSLKNDRAQDGGGYRTMVSVMSDVEMRNQLISEAFEEMERFQFKFKSLQELEGVFKEMDLIKQKVANKKLNVAA